MRARRNWKSAAVMIIDCYSHGVDRNPRYEAREEEPGETNPDRKRARDRLPRYDIAITNREAGDEGEINRVADRPALDEADQQTQGNLNRQNCRQHRPRKTNSVSEGHQEAPPHALWCPTFHAYSHVLVRFHYSCPSLTRRCSNLAQCGLFPSGGNSLSIAAKVACSVTTTCAPSPTAAATRLIEPERTSPTAKMPRRLVSSRLRLSLQSPPVKTKPFASNAMPDPDSQSVFGSAPMNKKRC